MNKQLNNPYTIFLDMDGVLCDFEKRVQDITGITDNIRLDKYRIPNSDLFIWYDKIYSLGEIFWENMDFLESGKQLWNDIKLYPNIEILSICSRNNFGYYGKTQWIKNNLGNNIPINLLPWGESKGLYANSNRILIDDYDKNINDWTACNGIGIKHISYDTTYTELSKYIKI